MQRQARTFTHLAANIRQSNYLKSEMLKDCTLVLVQTVEAINTTLKTMNVQKSSEVAPLLRFISRNDSPKCRYNFIRHTVTRKQVATPRQTRYFPSGELGSFCSRCVLLRQNYSHAIRDNNRQRIRLHYSSAYLLDH